MNLFDSNYEETKLINEMETFQELIEEEIHWFVKLINFLNLVNCCFSPKN